MKFNDCDIENIFINYYAENEFKNYVDWKTNLDDDNKIKKMSRDDRENMNVMGDVEEVNFYHTIFNSITDIKKNDHHSNKEKMKEMLEDKKKLLEPLFEDDFEDLDILIKENEIKEQLSISKIACENENEKFDLSNFNDEIITRFGKK